MLSPRSQDEHNECSLSPSFYGLYFYVLPCQPFCITTCFPGNISLQYRPIIESASLLDFVNFGTYSVDITSCTKIGINPIQRMDMYSSDMYGLLKSAAFSSHEPVLFVFIFILV